MNKFAIFVLVYEVTESATTENLEYILSGMEEVAAGQSHIKALDNATLTVTE